MVVVGEGSNRILIKLICNENLVTCGGNMIT